MKEFILFGKTDDGAGEAIEYIRKNGGEMLGWVDSNPAKQDEDAQVYAPSFVAKHPSATVVIMSDKIKEISEFIQRSGWENKIVVYPHLRSSYYDREILQQKAWCLENETSLREIYAQDDVYTVQLLDEMLAQRTAEIFSFIPLGRMIDFSHINLYFYDKAIAPQGDITLVNGGAYTGDSIEEIYRSYGERLKKIYAFEPDRNNISSLKKRMEKLGIVERVEPINCGLSDHEDSMLFSAEGTIASAFSETGEESVPLVTIDSMVQEVVGDLCINMDIEGFEVAALKGAKKSILKYHPYLAICVYHKMGDFLDVPNAIRDIRGDYKFYLRCGAHPECYAVPVRK